MLRFAGGLGWHVSVILTGIADTTLVPVYYSMCDTEVSKVSSVRNTAYM